ncbi:6741_t:CDS:1 [Acaulospora colombiana]|uniref:6741_t:CDS:1 n=1 Tax=Acaulospora colombiana TaxID=27376 RepID=A0ACA9NCZ5_9GLOM|nr:6741_t:CDS:1 [Acaulospora colombiana]
MFKILRAFQSRYLKARHEKRRSLPTLPYEIWLMILKMALSSNIIVEMDFEPLQIEAGFAFISNQALSSQQGAQKLALDIRKILRLVCRSWNQAVDSIKLNERWVVDHKYDDGEDSLPIDTRQCARLNVQCLVYPNSSLIRIHWTHPVPTVSLRIFAKAFVTSAYAMSLRDIVSFPEDIKALELHLGALKAEKVILTDLQTMSPRLTTLCLTLSRVELLQMPLEIPTLVTLFLSIPYYDSRDCSPTPRWTFPALRNLSLFRDVDEGLTLMMQDTNPSFAALLKDHFSQIESLLIHPMTRQIFYEDSSLCWIHMPKLRVLAVNTALIDFQYFGEPLPKSNLHILKSESVREIIQFHVDVIENEKIVTGLSKYILACNQLEGITLVDASDELIRELKRGTRTKEVKKLMHLCNNWRINLWEQHKDSLSERILIRDLHR